MIPVKIISGGQTGADQGGLFAARDLGIPTGGYAPKHYRTESGFCPELLQEFGLVEFGYSYSTRTRKNVKESDVTIWFGESGSPGFIATKRAAGTFDKPLLHFTTPTHVARYIIPMQWSIWNIAGNRESQNPGIFDFTRVNVIGLVKVVHEMGSQQRIS